MITADLVRDRAATPESRTGRISLQRLLLTCGILSPVLYAIADLTGGLTYPGYSFADYTISELMAIGAPSERFVDPLFLASGVLALLFGIAVLKESSGKNRALRITGLLLIVAAVAGFSGPTFFEIHRRGFITIKSETPHIVLSSVLGLLMTLATLSGAFALGKRFRSYSLATISVMILFAALMVPYTTMADAGQSTPGWGIVERIMIYSWLLWSVVLAAALRYRRE